MTEKEKIHIMSAGAHVHETFPIAVNNISPATEVYVIVEDRVYEDSDNPKTQKARMDIRNSIAKLKTIASPFVKNGVHEVNIEDDTLDHIRDDVFSIFKKKTDAQYYFNVSGGTKGLSIGLFMMALWIEAIPYHVDMQKEAKIIAIPKVHINDFQVNINRVKILEILSNSNSGTMERKKLFHELAKQYVPIRETGKAKRELKDGVFNSLTRDLLKWALISESLKEGSRKEKKYSITPDGEFTLKFVNISN